MLLARALSRTPSSSSQVISATMPNAGTLIRIGTPTMCGALSSRPCTAGSATEQRRAIAGGEPVGERDAAAEQRLEIVAPRDRDGHVADGVLEDQVPADDPGDDLAQRRIRIGVRAPGLRDHRRQFGVAEPGKRARRAGEHEREHQRGAGAGPHHMARRVDLARRRRSDRAEDAGADHRADGEHDQVAGAERPEQAAVALRRDRLALEE